MNIDTRHGGPYDRGNIDSYFCREFNPHYYTEGSYTSPIVEMADMTFEEIFEYIQGYNDNEEKGEHKNYECDDYDDDDDDDDSNNYSDEDNVNYEPLDEPDSGTDDLFQWLISQPRSNITFIELIRH